MFQTQEQRRAEESLKRADRKAALLEVVNSTDRALLIAILFALPEDSRGNARGILAGLCQFDLVGEDLSKEVWRMLRGLSFMQGEPEFS